MKNDFVPCIINIFIKLQFFNRLGIGIRNLRALLPQSSGGNKLIGVLTVVACKQHFTKSGIVNAT